MSSVPQHSLTNSFLANCASAATHSTSPSLRTRATSNAAEAATSKKILVLGGTGFVGSEICRLALSRGYAVVSVSRRGQGQVEGVDWRKGDVVKNPDIVNKILSEGSFYGVLHTIGMLLEGDFNKFASGSGSVPTPGTTYDQVTRQTALAAASAFASSDQEVGSPPPFVFVSAAEAGWTQDPPVPFLVSYLTAKRAVEAQLMSNFSANSLLRPIILRPSLVYSMDRAASLPAVGAFVLGNMLGIPGIDRPVSVETLAKAALKGLEDDSVVGVQNGKAMEQLATAL
eukprot:CAMPEP_0198213610 /NCGR_PEP_ID=MMETSP1445-20131203/28964_1 /TAXON_ID=36898 /ORGANISM="Pyramimonas sp., Strain CCMP2087" /LENGTH=284 /DNA_ID=CAMNT_0043888277 /DNA_START=225 /DNA_END=1079 /DNA_ORIENTATION=+